jgi:hypothetical protein
MDWRRYAWWVFGAGLVIVLIVAWRWLFGKNAAWWQRIIAGLLVIAAVGWAVSPAGEAVAQAVDTATLKLREAVQYGFAPQASQPPQAAGSGSVSPTGSGSAQG